MPITVPRKQPTKHQKMFAGSMAMPKPCISPLKASIGQNPQMALVGNGDSRSSEKPR